MKEVSNFQLYIVRNLIMQKFKAWKFNVAKLLDI